MNNAQPAKWFVSQDAMNRVSHTGGHHWNYCPDALNSSTDYAIKWYMTESNKWKVSHLSSHCNWFEAWWRHQMEPFTPLLAFCAVNSPVIGEFPAQRPVTRSFDVFFDLRLNKQLSKQLWGWWFETQSCPSWRHCSEKYMSFQKSNELKRYIIGCQDSSVSNDH